MYFVSYGPAPEKLEVYKKEYTRKWIEFYQNNQGTDPSKSYDFWTKDEIRIPLIERFEDNCGYCGVEIGEKESKNGKIKIPDGEVDHYRPKSKCPAYVYHWENYIWSCRNCNRRKSDYYDPDLMLLFPGDIEDTRILELRRDGKYYFKEEFSDNKVLKKRFKMTCKMTLLNSTKRSESRKWMKHVIDSIEKSLPENWAWLQMDGFQKLDPGDKLEIRKELHDSISLLKEILESKSYKKMVRTILTPGPDLIDEWMTWHKLEQHNIENTRERSRRSNTR